MGNAINFQTKFQRIAAMKERQDFLGVWTEYGDLFYIIWTFQPLESSARQEINTFVERWMEDHQWLADDTPEVQRQIVKAGVSTFAQFVHSAGEELGRYFQAAYNVIEDTIVTYRNNLAAARTLYVQTSPKVQAAAKSMTTKL